MVAVRHLHLRVKADLHLHLLHLPVCIKIIVIYRGFLGLKYVTLPVGRQLLPVCIHFYPFVHLLFAVASLHSVGIA